MTGTEGSVTGDKHDGLQECGGCFFFHRANPKKDEPAECHFYPPKPFVFQVPKMGNAKGISLASKQMVMDISVDYQGQTMWPNVMESTVGCGFHKPKE